MSQDLDDILRSWPFATDCVQARLVTTTDGRQVIQVRVDLGVLQLEVVGRPDGDRPHGFGTYFEYLRAQARRDPNFVLSEEQCQEADREFVQFYHRRIAWLALRRFAEAVGDADHTLAFMDLLHQLSPNTEYTEAHEKYRNFVLFHRIQAAAAQSAEQDQPEQALDEIRTGLAGMRRFFANHEMEDRMDDDIMVQALRKLDRSLRELHGIEETLQERLDAAIANEEYETAARLRDELRRRQ